MKFIKSKKGLAMLAALVVVGASAFGAYAYLTSNGSGSGTALTGTNSTVIHLVGTVTDGLVPGSFEPISFKAYNDSTTSTGYVAGVSLGTVSDPGGTAGCISYLAAHQADFSLTDTSDGAAPITEGNAVPANTTAVTAVSLTNGGRVHWANSATVDQTPCIGDTLTIGLTST